MTGDQSDLDRGYATLSGGVPHQITPQRSDADDAIDPAEMRTTRHALGGVAPLPPPHRKGRSDLDQ